MKVNDILNEMTDDDIISDTGEKPVRGVTPDEKKAAWMKKNAEKVAAMKAERDWGRGRRGSRLTGRGRGTGGADQSMVQK